MELVRVNFGCDDFLSSQSYTILIIACGQLYQHKITVTLHPNEAPCGHFCLIWTKYVYYHRTLLLQDKKFYLLGCIHISFEYD